MPPDCLAQLLAGIGATAAPLAPAPAAAPLAPARGEGSGVGGGEGGGGDGGGEGRAAAPYKRPRQSDSAVPNPRQSARDAVVAKRRKA